MMVRTHTDLRRREFCSNQPHMMVFMSRTQSTARESASYTNQLLLTSTSTWKPQAQRIQNAKCSPMQEEDPMAPCQGIMEAMALLDVSMRCHHPRMTGTNSTEGLPTDIPDRIVINPCTSTIRFNQPRNMPACLRRTPLTAHISCNPRYRPPHKIVITSQLVLSRQCGLPLLNFIRHRGALRCRHPRHQYEDTNPSDQALLQSRCALT